jgi:hypothetical protein
MFHKLKKELGLNQKLHNENIQIPNVFWINGTDLHRKEFGMSSTVVRASASSLFSLFKIINEYKLTNQHRKIISSLKTMKKASKESDMSANNLKTSIKIINHYLKITKS